MKGFINFVRMLICDFEFLSDQDKRDMCIRT